MSETKAEYKVRLVIYVDADTSRAVRMEAVNRGLSISDIVREALQSRVTLISKPRPETKK